MTSPVGQCGSCQHTQVIVSDKGSTFHRCRRSETDTTFPKYPRLPVLECRGYEQNEPKK